MGLLGVTGLGTLGPIVVVGVLRVRGMPGATILIFLGVYAVGLVGTTLVWGLVNDTQPADWHNINDTQDPGWAPVSNAQLPSWAPIADSQIPEWSAVTAAPPTEWAPVD